VSFGTVTDRQDGSYDAVVSAGAAGTPVVVGATIDGQPVTTALPQVLVVGACAVRTAGLILHLDASRVDGAAAVSCPPGAAAWQDVALGGVGALHGYVAADPGCDGASSGWNGTGVAADPARLSTDGIDDYVTVPHQVGYNTRTFTLEVWMRRRGVGVTASTGASGIDIEPLLAKGTAEAEDPLKDENYVLGITGAGTVGTDFEAYDGSGNMPLTGAAVLAVDTWYQIVVTYDEATRRIFVNGGLDREEFRSLRANDRNTVDVGIGAMVTSTGAPAGYFKGDIAVVRVYDTALSLAQVRENCLAQASRVALICQ
jgi:hypothetical protein